MECAALGARDLTVSESVSTAASRLAVAGSTIDVLEVHAPYSHQELIVIDALAEAEVGTVCPSGGALPADPVMATGLIRLGAAADAVRHGRARRAVAHATNGPCLQHNLLCLLEAG
jgi:acetyl-CoA acetyltransferase